MRRLLLFSFLAIILSIIYNVYSEEENTSPKFITLTVDNFEEETQFLESNSSSSTIWIINFHISFYSKCKNFLPLWRETIKSIYNNYIDNKSDLKFGEFDASENLGMSRRFEINQYPHIIVATNKNYYSFPGTQKGLEDLKKFMNYNKKLLKEGKLIPEYKYIKYLDAEPVGILSYKELINAQIKEDYNYVMDTKRAIIGLIFGVSFGAGIIICFIWNIIYGNNNNNKNKNKNKTKK